MNGTGNEQGSCAVAVPVEPAYGKWQSIDAAPVSPWAETLPSYYRFSCLLAERGSVFEGYAEYTYKRRQLVWKNAALYGRSCNPTHWMPLPAPPEATP